MTLTMNQPMSDSVPVPKPVMEMPNIHAAAAIVVLLISQFDFMDSVY